MNKIWKTTGPFRYDLNQIPYHYTVEMTKKIQGITFNRVLQELWTEVHNIVQESVIILKKKKHKKAKWSSEKALQITEKRREVKGKGKIYVSECRIPENSKER